MVLELQPESACALGRCGLYRFPKSDQRSIGYVTEQREAAMKRITIATLMFAAFLATATTASAAIVEFRGVFVITALTSACEVFGWSVGSLAKSPYTPPNVGDNGPSTRLSIFFTIYAENYRLPSGALTSTFQNVDAGGLGRGLFTFDNQAKMRLTLSKPSTVTATTQYIRMKGQIKNFNDIPNCKVTFRAAYVQRP